MSKDDHATEIERLKTENETLRQRTTELSKRLNEVEMILDAMPIMLWYKDRQNRNVRVNKAAAALEGLPQSEVEGKSAYDLYPKEQADAFYKDDLEVINSGKPKPNILEKHTSPATGEEMWLQTGKTPLRDADDTIVGVLAFAVDVTAQKQAEEVVRQAHKTVEQQNQRLARVHEFFRSTLDQMIETIERGTTHNELLGYLKNARHEFERLD